MKDDLAVAMSDTPRTDAIECENAGSLLEDCARYSELARQLERELARMERERDHWAKNAGDRVQADAEREQKRWKMTDEGPVGE